MRTDGWWVARQVVRLAVELAAALLVALALTSAVMVTMFYFGPWADPPGIGELGAIISGLVVVVAIWRAVQRWRGAHRSPADNFTVLL